MSDVVWPGLPPQPERPLLDTDRYVALVSGLQLADRKADMMQVSHCRVRRGGVRVGVGLQLANRKADICRCVCVWLWCLGAWVWLLRLQCLNFGRGCHPTVHTNTHRSSCWSIF